MRIAMSSRDASALPGALGLPDASELRDRLRVTARRARSQGAGRIFNFQRFRTPMSWIEHLTFTEVVRAYASEN
jgi:hypothetical protein